MKWKRPRRKATAQHKSHKKAVNFFGKGFYQHEFPEKKKQPINLSISATRIPRPKTATRTPLGANPPEENYRHVRCLRISLNGSDVLERPLIIGASEEDDRKKIQIRSRSTSFKIRFGEGRRVPLAVRHQSGLKGRGRQGEVGGRGERCRGSRGGTRPLRMRQGEIS